MKISELPADVKEEAGGARTFTVGTEAPRFVVTLNKKAWKRLVTAAEQFPEWVAILTGKHGERIDEHTYRVDNPGLANVVERKPKEAPTAAAEDSNA